MPDFLFTVVMTKPLWLWLVFAVIVITLLILDLGVLHKKQKEIQVKESLMLYGFYMVLAFAYGGWIWYELGHQKGMEYFTGYIIEQSLSMDNLFVMSMIFGFFHIPRKYQHRVLFWGILGVVVLRGIMIGLGATLIAQFHWILYFFAAFLVYSGIKMIALADKEIDIAHNPILRLMRKYMRVTDKLHEEHFTYRMVDPNTGKYATYLTPLFVALILIEFADLIFAVDSIPAIFAITTDPYIVFTSNIFAVLGLRALYFALAAMVDRFKYLKYALALVLMFIGSKIFIVDFTDLNHIPPAISLGVTFGILGAGIAYSLWRTRNEA